jgi:tetratricopeptide (TPR) repeat protein
MCRKKTVISIIFLLFVFYSYALNSFEQGEALFLENKPEEAMLYLENALAVDPSNEKIYYYLGYIYEQLGNHQKAINILQRGIDIAVFYKDQFYFNIGLNFRDLGENVLAEEMYTKAIAVNSLYPEPYLCRANSRIELDNYEGALSDYERFLVLKPNTFQRAEIEKMIALLSEMITEAARLEEEQRLRDEALINDVLNSLKNASEDSENISEGTDVILEGDDEEIDIDE